MSIASYLCPHHIKGTPEKSSHPGSLSRLSRTCTRLRDLLRPILFHSNLGAPDPVTFLSFLRAITTHPLLAQAVKTLYLVSRDMSTPSELNDMFGKDDNGEYDLESAYTKQDKEFLNTCLNHVGFHPANWSINGRQRNPHIEVAIASCVNVEALDFLMIRAVPSFVSAIDSNFQLHLPRLQSLTIRWMLFADALFLEYNRLAPFLAAAPNLKHLALPTVTNFLPTTSNIPEMEHLEVLDFGQASLPSHLFAVSSHAART
ncbi:hypothetical protein BDV06DRAFT_145273 [Aspergillus oleicola]